MELSPDSTNPINTNLTELIFRNCKIIDRSDHWSLLLFKESLDIYADDNLISTTVGKLPKNFIFH